MDDDQTCPEHVLLVAMERAFRGPAYANAQTRDWRTHMARVLQCVRENDPMVACLRWHVEALDRACRMALEALTLATDAGEDEAERWSVSGGTYEAVKCVAAINAIRAAIPMRYEELCAGREGMNDAKQATPAAELERQICSATEPKNEREWWAHREIERLRDRLSVETLALVETLARAERAEAEVERLREAEAELHEIASVLPGVAYMDPPDGGSPSIAEQVRRMRADLDRTAAEVERLRAERVITASPWRYQEWGGLVVGGGEGSAEVLICTMATNTRHDEGRHNRELIIEAPTLRARLDKAEAEVERLRAALNTAMWAMQQPLDQWKGECERKALNEARAALKEE